MGNFPRYGRAPVQLALWTPEIAAAMKGWMAFPSMDLLKSDGLEVFARRNKDMAQGSLPAGVLHSHLPTDPRELATGGSGTISIKDLVHRHRGEVREVTGSGHWCPYTGKAPATAHHPQLKDLILQQRAPASGGSTELHVRVARVFGRTDLFVAHGHAFTANQLYNVYLSCPVIAQRRQRKSTNQ